MSLYRNSIKPSLKNFLKRQGLFLQAKRVQSLIYIIFLPESRHKEVDRKHGFRQARKRAKKLQKYIFSNLPFEMVEKCPLSYETKECERTIVATHDRYGFPVRLALCHETGLLYLVDRLTPNGYDTFYKHGLYRKLVADFWGWSKDKEGKKSSLIKQNIGAKADAQVIVNAVKPYISFPDNATLLDIGGSTGALAKAFVDVFHIKATVLDPAEEELKIAASLGLETKLGVMEQTNFRKDEKYNIILVNQTIEHVINILDVFKKIDLLLDTNGYVIFNILDFLSEIERMGCAEAASRLDHCHFLYDEMIDIFCKRVGLNIKKRLWFNGNSILYICCKGKADPAATLPEERRLQILRRLDVCQDAWEHSPYFWRL